MARSTGSTFQPLRNRPFRNIWIASVLSQLGWMIQTVGASWMMTMLTDSRTMVALVPASTFLPIMLLSLPMGVLADNFDRRRIMIVAQILMMAGSVVLAVITLLGWTTPVLLLALSFLIASGTAIYNPAWQASYFDILGKDGVPAAVTLHSMGVNSMRSIGPAVGGLIVTFAGVTAAFAINAVSYVPLIVALLRWQPGKSLRAPVRENFGESLVSGLRYVGMSSNLLVVIVRSMLFGAGASSLTALMPLVASELLGGGAIMYGTLLASFGVGAIVGGVATPLLREHTNNEAVARIACIGTAITALVIGYHQQAWSSYITLLVAGACWTLVISMFNVSFQLAVPRWVLARALSIYQTTFFGGLALGSGLWGLIANNYGLQPALLAAALLLTTNAALGLVARCADFTQDDLEPLYEPADHDPGDKVSARSGPILILVEFRIAEEDVPEFLSVMARRRRVRIRDGAKQWTLSRDLQRREIWIEGYRVADWRSYGLHTGRRTKADAELLTQLRKFHRGDEPPRVSRMLVTDPHGRRRHGDMPATIVTDI